MEGQELIAFEIISAVGTARSSYIEAITCAKHGDIAGAYQRIKEGDELFVEGHKAHAKLLAEVGEDSGSVGLLILHAEDQLMSAEGFKTVALEFIDAYTRVETLEKRVAALERQNRKAE